MRHNKAAMLSALIMSAIHLLPEHIIEAGEKLPDLPPPPPTVRKGPHQGKKEMARRQKKLARMMRPE